MCRMLIIIEEQAGALKSLRKQLYESLVKAAHKDPHSVRLFGEDEESHRDGWGVLSAEVGGEGVERYMVYRSLKPIFEDEIPWNAMERRNPGAEILHARAASTGMPVNMFSVHPVEAQSPKGYRIFLAHNGSMDKDGLARAVGASETELQLYNDSYFLARFLAAGLEDLSGGEALLRASKYTETAMNLAFLFLSPQEQLLVVGSYYRLRDKPRERRNYYKLYMGYGDGFIVYASSTIVDYYNPAPGLIEWVEVPNGGFDLYRIGGGGIRREGRVMIGGVG